MSSLVVISNLGGGAGTCPREPSGDARFGTIDDIGFIEGEDEALSRRPPRPETLPYDGECQDRFLIVERSEGGPSIGSVTIHEALVYDNHMCGDLEFTGFRLSLLLRKDMHQAYLDYVGGLARQKASSDAWDGRIRFRVPSPPFNFPMPRGSSKPWNTHARAVGRLRPIRQFSFDEIEIEALGRVPGSVAHGERPALCLHAPRSRLPRIADRLLRLGR